MATPANQQDYATLLVTGNNTYTGGTNINAGRLVITNANSLGTGLITVGGPNGNSTGGTLAFGNGNYTTNGASGIITGTGITVANAVNLAGATSGNYGHGIENNIGNNTLSGVVTLTGSAIVQVNNLTTLSMTNAAGVGQAAGVTASLTKQGNGTLVVNNATYTGGTTISAGNLQFTGNTPAGAAGSITIAAAGALNVGPGTAFAGATPINTLFGSGLVAGGGTSTGSITLTGNDAETLDFSTAAASPYTGLSIGSAVPVSAAAPNGAVFSGQILNEQFLNLGGGGNGRLALPSNNQIADLPGATPVLLTIGPIGSGGTVAITGTNAGLTGAAGSIVAIAGGTLQFANGSLGTAAIQFGGYTTGGGGGTLQYAPGNTEDITTTHAVTNAGNVIIDTNGNNVSYANAIGNGPGQFTKAGLGTPDAQRRRRSAGKRHYRRDHQRRQPVRPAGQPDRQ